MSKSASTPIPSSPKPKAPPAAQPEPAAVEPVAVDPAAAEPAAADPEAADAEPVAEPLNRAERRAKAKQADPSHVGPREGFARQVRGARSHSKRATS